MLRSIASLRRLMAPHKRRNFFFLSRVQFSCSIQDDQVDAQRYVEQFKAFRDSGAIAIAVKPRWRMFTALKKVFKLFQRGERVESIETELRKTSQSLIDSYSKKDSKALSKALQQLATSKETCHEMKLLDSVVRAIGAEKSEKLEKFLVSLDCQVKGLISHWQVRRMERSSLEKKPQHEIQRKMGSKVAILVGDLYHTKAYFLTSHLGNNKLCRILALIEQNFAKINYTSEMEQSRFQELHLKIYKHFYNFLPTLIGYGLQGIAEFTSSEGLQDYAHEVGVQMGFFLQFLTLSYILTSLVDERLVAAISKKLDEFSSLLHFMTEQQISSLVNKLSPEEVKSLRDDFIYLTLLHGTRINELSEQLKSENSVFFKEVVRGVTLLSHEMLTFLKFEVATK